MRFQTGAALRAVIGGTTGCALGAALGYLACRAFGATPSDTGLPVTDAAVDGVGHAVRAVTLALVGGALGAAVGIAVALRMFRTPRWD